jgi:hypothetical protein
MCVSSYYHICVLMLQVDLDRNHVGDEGASALALALAHNGRLRTLGIAWNKVTLKLLVCEALSY